MNDIRTGACASWFIILLIHFTCHLAEINVHTKTKSLDIEYTCILMSKKTNQCFRNVKKFRCLRPPFNNLN